MKCLGLQCLPALAAVLLGVASQAAAGVIVVNFGRFPSAEAAGRAEAEIDWGDTDSPDAVACTQCFAAMELQHYLRKMTGRSDDFVIQSDTAATEGDLILIGGPATNAASRRLAKTLNVDPEKLRLLGLEGYRIKSGTVAGQNVLVIAGSGRVGTLYGVYDLLHRLGCRWFAPGETHEEVPRIERIVEFDVTEQPAFTTRGFFAWENRGNPDFFLWMARNRVNLWCVEQDGHPLLQKLGIRMACAQHDAVEMFLHPELPYPYAHPRFSGGGDRPNDPYPVSPQYQGDADKDGKLSYFEAHPEWFALVDGKRIPGIRHDQHGANYCTSNTDATAEFLKNYVQALIDGPYRDAGIVRFMLLDTSGTRWCECETCKALGIPTDRYLRLVWQFDRAIKKARAEGKIRRPIEIRFIVYGDVLSPPTRPLPADFDYETCVGTFYPIARCYVHNFDDPGCELRPGDARESSNNAHYVRQLHRWTADPARFYRGRITIGEYYNLSSYRCLPICYMHTMAHDISYFHRIGARGFDYMHVTTGNWGNKALTNYQMARQLWDINTDCPALWEDYFAGRYGLASGVMRRFYESLERMSSNISELANRLARRLGAGEERLLASSHLQFERKPGVVCDGPTLTEIVGFSVECRKLIDEAAEMDLPPRLRARIAEDQRMFTYGERTVSYWYECVQAFQLARAGCRDEARRHYAEAVRLADLLRADTTSTTLASSHANAPDAFRGTFASGALGHLERLLGPLPAVSAENYDRLRLGDRDSGRILVPTNQVLSPLGEQIAFAARPTAVALSPDGRWLAVLGHDRVLVIDLELRRVAGQVRQFSGSFIGIIFARDAERLLASSTKGVIQEFAVSAEGGLEAVRSIKLPPLPQGQSTGDVAAGLALDPGGKTFWAALNLSNTVAEIDLATGEVLRQIPVGNAPFDVAVAAGKLYVSNWAGRHPGPGDTTGPSGRATPVRVDAKAHIASEGSVSVVDFRQMAASKGRVPFSSNENRDGPPKEIVVGPHSSGLAVSPDGRYVCVASANADTVSVIDAARDKIVDTITTRPAPELLLGSAPNALRFSPNGRTLYVSNGGNNAVAVVAFDPPKSRLLGCMPTGWYPAGLALDEKRQALYVANVKGIGSRSTEAKGKRKVKGNTVWGYNTLEPLGTVSLIPLPKAEELPQLTERVLANNRLSEARRALVEPRKDAPPRPVPERCGEPSVFKHVLYIIKENRTYDQVFGDVPRGEGDPQLCIFGQHVTPNHHKLADEFVLLDNFYCSGVLSADGHQWTDEAYATDYIEKSFGGWPRSYPYDGNDAMAYARSGFLWDNALARGRTLRVYGEFVKGTVRWRDPERTGNPTFLDCYRDFLHGSGKIDIRATAAIKTLEPYICPTAIGFPNTVPDLHRAQQFLDELREFERRGEMPNLMILMLPNDHTSGTRPGYPTPEAYVAHNDLALGRIVEAVSRSRFWPQTCMFVVEDDPQNGFDHIDGHRTVALVLSPYSRRGGLDSTNYNQTSMVRTIEQILGLPPMNQFDASATPMASCFAAEPDLRPYEALPNNVPLDQMNPQLSEIKDPRQRHWAEVSLRLPLEDVDEADEDTLNRILWHAQRGRDDTYPAWAVRYTADK